MHILCMAFLTSLFFFSMPVYAQEKLVIFTEQFPPYNFQNDAAITGINVELMRSLCKDVGISCEFEIYPWNRAYQKTLNTKNSGLISTSRHPDREMYFKWVGPLISSSQRACLYKLKTRDDIKNVTKETLKNYSLAVNQNDIYHQVFKQWGLTDANNFLFYANKLEGIEAFKRGKLDLLMGSRLTLVDSLNNSGLTIDDIEPVFHLKDPMLRGNYLALNRNVTDDLAVSLDNSLLAFDEEKKQALITKFVPSANDSADKSPLKQICF